MQDGKKPLSQALRSNANTRSISGSTATRWITRGVAGVKLTAVRVGGRWFVSDEDLAQFLQAINGAPADALRSPSERTKASDLAALQLDAVGA